LTFGEPHRVATPARTVPAITEVAFHHYVRDSTEPGQGSQLGPSPGAVPVTLLRQCRRPGAVRATCRTGALAPRHPPPQSPGPASSTERATRPMRSPRRATGFELLECSTRKSGLGRSHLRSCTPVPTDDETDPAAHTRDTEDYRHVREHPLGFPNCGTSRAQPRAPVAAAPWGLSAATPVEAHGVIGRRRGRRFGVHPARPRDQVRSAAQSVAAGLRPEGTAHVEENASRDPGRSGHDDSDTQRGVRPERARRCTSVGVVHERRNARPRRFAVSVRIPGGRVPIPSPRKSSVPCCSKGVDALGRVSRRATLRDARDHGSRTKASRRVGACRSVGFVPTMQCARPEPGRCRPSRNARPLCHGVGPNPSRAVVDLLQAATASETCSLIILPYCEAIAPELDVDIPLGNVMGPPPLRALTGPGLRNGNVGPAGSGGATTASVAIAAWRGRPRVSRVDPTDEQRVRRLERRGGTRPSPCSGRGRT